MHSCAFKYTYANAVLQMVAPSKARSESHRLFDVLGTVGSMLCMLINLRQVKNCCIAKTETLLGGFRKTLCNEDMEM